MHYTKDVMWSHIYREMTGNAMQNVSPTFAIYMAQFNSRGPFQCHHSQKPMLSAKQSTLFTDRHLVYEQCIVRDRYY